MSSNSGFSNIPTNQLPHIVGKLFYEDELDLGQISYLIGVSRHVVGKILSQARRANIVKIEVQPYNSRNTELEDELITKYGLQSAFVLKTEGFNTELTRRVVGYFASGFASEFIQSNMIIGVGGGRCLSELISRINPRSGVYGIITTQLMGNYSSLITNIDSYELAYSLAKKYLGSYYTAESLLYHPNPNSFLQEKNNARVASMVSYYNKIQLAFIGIGSLNDYYITDRNSLGLDYISSLSEKQAVGEIVGRFITKQGTECDWSLKNCTSSIELDVLKKINNIVLVAVGRRKSEAIHYAATHKFCHVLITDSLTAKDVLEMRH